MMCCSISEFLDQVELCERFLIERFFCLIFVDVCVKRRSGVVLSCDSERIASLSHEPFCCCTDCNDNE